ncbi:MAG: hypothetical protein PHI93_11430 [Kiritimatiellae bacterium]|nr:hypothetical protein [Kiritimatiellia bacterium]
MNIGRSLLLLCLLLTAATTHAEQPSARQAFAEGQQAFAASNYAAAADSFQAAAAAAPASKLDPAAAHLNAGIAALAAGDAEAASTHFAAAADGGDLALQAQAYYNRGNSLFQLADSPLQPQALPAGAPPPADLDVSSDAITEAIQMYENAIALDPGDADAKANYELAILKQQQIQQMQQQQQEQPQQDDEQEDDSHDQPPQPSDQHEQEQDQPDQEDKQDQQAQQQPEPGDQQEQEQTTTEAPESAEDMTPEEAEMLLDSLKAQEQSQRDRLHPFLGRPVPVEKDW